MPSTDRLLIQVVAQLKPERCGVSDHAILLARELEAAFAIRTAFVVLNSSEPCNVAYPRVYCPPSQLLETCNSLGNDRFTALLVHCSGYGYSRDGAPFPLAEALEQVRKNGRFHIAAYFHELYATGMPWKSAFWYTRRQQKVVRRVAGACDLIATNSTRHKQWLEREAIHGAVPAVRLLPMFSNVAESPVTPTLRGRRPALVIFGLADTRRKAYARLASLGMLFDTLGVEEIVDVGPELAVPAELGGIRIRRMGVLAAPDLAEVLSHSMFGFAQHKPFGLAKSGVFAGLCALGVIPVIAESFSGEVDGLKDGVHVVSPATAGAVKNDGLERCSTAAWIWYSQHRLHVHAAEYAAWMDGLAPTVGTGKAGAELRPISTSAEV
jgi:hypothetical protein